MFTRNIPTLIQKGVEVSPLFNSKIFSFQFDYDEWPSTHSDNKSYMIPYNDSIFDLRSNYQQTFGQLIPECINMNNEEGIQDTSKMYKVKYQMNMLSMIEMYAVEQEDGSFDYQNPDVSFMELIVDSDQLDIFESNNVQDLIKYKWNKFAQRFHIKGFIFHFMYLVIMSIFVDQIYVKNNLEYKKVYCVLLGVGILYPTWYVMFKIYKLGLRTYFIDFSNRIDLLYTIVGILNVFLQSYGEP